MGTGFLKKAPGARRDRTADLLHAMQALSQLSYSPNLSLKEEGFYEVEGALVNLNVRKTLIEI